MNPPNGFRLDHPIRSKLFVPGSRPELFEKAIATAADALSFDLEDSVVRDRKEEAREAVAGFLRGGRVAKEKIVIVRVNHPSSDLFGPDVAALVGTGLDVINLPKMESRDEVLQALDVVVKAERASGIQRTIGILANIETPRGLRLAAEIATADPRVMGLQIGFNDFCSCCGIDSRDKIALQAVRLAVRFAAAEAGIAAFDGAFADVKHPEAFRAEAEDSRSLGFSGKSCIHPTQVPIANEVFSPRTEEIAEAEKVLAAAGEATGRGDGAFVVDGRMIDNPIIAQARAVIARATKLGIASRKQGV